MRVVEKAQKTTTLLLPPPPLPITRSLLLDFNLALANAGKSIGLEDGETNDETLAFANRFISRFHEIQEAIKKIKMKISSFTAVDPKET